MLARRGSCSLQIASAKRSHDGRSSSIGIRLSIQTFILHDAATDRAGPREAAFVAREGWHLGVTGLRARTRASWAQEYPMPFPLRLGDVTIPGAGHRSSHSANQ